MASRLLGSVVLAALLGAPALAQSQQPSAAPTPAATPTAPSAVPSAAPIRTLQYTVAVTVSQTRESAGNGNGRTLTAGGYEAKGTISVDVLAATLDGGLLVDTTENAAGRMEPKTIVSIGGDGRLSYDAKQQAPLSDEQTALLRWLARTFYADRSTDPGTAWSVDLNSGPNKGVERYRVISNADGKVDLEYRLEANGSTPSTYTLTRSGTIVYDTKLTVPVQVSYRGDQHDRGGATTTTSVAINLTADSFSR
ncbi:MAG TPA: hypothetical protein VMA36_13825 [Candidatus Limnocylindria bacterium]|jgi:hypothetical protein|nr:hypothetical protein [Candidatus Limnocylindria bacterium]